MRISPTQSPKTRPAPWESSLQPARAGVRDRFELAGPWASALRLIFSTRHLTPVASLKWTLTFILAVLSGIAASTAHAQARRLVFLGPQAPVLVEVTIDSGRFSVEETRRRYADGLFDLLDVDRDGKLNPEEAAKVPRNGRIRQRLETLGDGWKELDAAPADGALSKAELFAFIDSVFGPTLSVVQQAPRLAQTVRLYDDLDINRDGRIDADEVEQGLSVLRTFDFDDDETLSLAELQPFPNSVLQARQQAQQEDRTNPLMLLGTDEEIARAAALCLTTYGAGQPDVAREKMPALEDRSFRLFDRSRDGKWDEAETLLFLRRGPVKFQMAVSLDSRTVRIAAAAGKPEGGQIDAAGVPVEWVARSRLSQRLDAMRLFMTRVRTSDNDKNGYLDEAEFTGLQAGDATFQVVDLDGNQQVVVAEVEKFFTLDGLAGQSQLQLSLSDEAKTLFDVLDDDRDRRLKPREFAEGRRRLLMYDANQDGALVAGEFTSAYKVTFSQPELIDTGPVDALNQPGMANPGFAQPVAAVGPVWFQKMDRNNDQEVSWREFLGPRSAFEKLDANGDGWIDAEEATMVEG